MRDNNAINDDNGGCEIIEFTASGGVRLDVEVADKCGITRSRAKTLIEKGNVTVSGAEIVKSGAAIKSGAIVRVVFEPLVQLNLEPCDIPVNIVYEDDYLAVINKSRGMVVHPAGGSPDGTLVNALLHRLDKLSGINGVARPGIVHRLDKDTSGLLVVAKTDAAHIDLQAQIQAKTAKRNYIALTDGVVLKDCGEIITNIDRSKRDRKIMAVVKEGGRVADTVYRVLKRFDRYTLMEYELKTGRTHQIRVHSKHIGHPIVGDAVYGGSTKLYDKGQLLHAYKLAFTHPITRDNMVFTAMPPGYFMDVLNAIDKNGGGYDFSKLMDDKTVSSN